MSVLQGFPLSMHCLARWPNQTATEVLLMAIRGPSRGVRQGALQALGRRSDRESQLQFVRLFEQLDPCDLAALPHLPLNFRRTLLEILQAQNVRDCELATRVLLHYGAYEELPTLVNAAAVPGHPWGDGLAAACFQLASRLQADVARYQEHPMGRDPSFARHWGAGALASAVDRFGDHRRVELVEAFLLLVRPDNPILRRLLDDTSHPCHQPLLTALKESHSSGAIGLMAALFEDPAAPLELVELAASRSDAAFRKAFLAALGWPLSPRALAGVRRVRRLHWLHEPDPTWLHLTETEQAAAIELATASRLTRREKLAIVDFLFASGAPLARQAACACLGRIESPDAMLRLEQALDDRDPLVVATAAKILRRTGNTRAVPQLAALLDHQHHEVRTSAQLALCDFTFVKYLADFDTFEPSLQDELGRIVSRSDPQAVEQLRGELSGATIPRKLRALHMTRSMRQVDAVLGDVLRLADHKDLEVRCEVLDTLVHSLSQEAREVIVTATGDPNPIVRKRAIEALKQFDAKLDRERGPA
jgi:HEAT repeat protein